MNDGFFKRVVGGAVMTCGVCFGVLMFSAVQAATLQVQPGGTDTGNCQALPCQSIAYALSQAAASGDTLQVAAGTYVEQLTINKSVTVLGAGSASTIIRAPAVLATNPAISPGSGGQLTAIVFVTGASTDASMSDLQVRGPGPGSSGSIGYGVFVGGNARFTLDHTHITAIRDEPFANSQNGGGVRFGAPGTGQVGLGQVLDSVIDGFQKNGVTVSNAGSHVTLRGNTITGTMPPPTIAQNGIQISGGAVALVEDNTISNLQCSTSNPNCGLDGSWSIGVLLSSAGAGTEVINNRVSHADGNLYAVGSSAQAYTVTGNGFSDATYVNVTAGGVALNMMGNTLSGAEVGLFAAGSSTATTVNLNGGNRIFNATRQGIRTVTSPGALPVLVSGSGNQFYSNLTGAENPDLAPAIVLDLPCNWWGNSTGPTHPGNPLGRGNSVSDGIQYINWAIDNTTFACVGNPQRNEFMARTPAPVPSNGLWGLFAMALALAGLGSLTLRGRPGA
ncbi:right-handed parallel beta-helix repeat-containing protein [Ottowia thiooxydans]|uniref:Right handed beta helix domain-containing protein n=1 Tax=Ottowia thiooxydans TaxID=219182 RepID=A0ABV2QF04_9BURK